MENKNNNKGVIALLVVIIVILAVLCVLFATGTISLNTSTTNNNEQTTGNNGNTDNTETSTNDSNNLNWTQYILEQHIIDAKAFTVEKTSTVTLDDLKEALPKFENTKLIKSYYNSRGSLIDGVTMNISYSTSEEADAQKYQLTISANNNYCEIYSVKELDDTLLNILDNAKTSEKNTELKNQGVEIEYFYELDGCDSSVLDKYVK